MSTDNLRDTSGLKARKEPTQERAEVLVQAVLEAATRILDSGELADFTVARVCEVAGVSPGSLYQYFPSKDAIAYALLRQHATEVIDAVTRALLGHRDAPAGLLIDATVEAFVVAHQTRPRVHARLGAWVTQKAGPGMEEDLLVHATSALAEIIDRRRDELDGRDPQVVAFLLIHGVEGAVHAAARRAPERLAEPAFLHGLQAMARAVVGAPPRSDDDHTLS